MDMLYKTPPTAPLLPLPYLSCLGNALLVPAPCSDIFPWFPALGKLHKSQTCCQVTPSPLHYCGTRAEVPREVCWPKGAGSLLAAYGVSHMWVAAFIGISGKADPMPALPGGRMPTRLGHVHAKTIGKPHSKNRNNAHGISKRVLPIIKGFWKQNHPAERFRNDVQKKLL